MLNSTEDDSCEAAFIGGMEDGGEADPSEAGQTNNRTEDIWRMRSLVLLVNNKTVP